MGAGAGRGVIATRDIAAGELLMLCQPLAYAAGPEGDIPSMEDLVVKWVHESVHVVHMVQRFVIV